MADKKSRTVHWLSARQVATETRKGVYCDGGGLYLQVGNRAAKSWVFKFRMPGKKLRCMGLGSVNTFSLRDARRAARDARQLVYERTDPIEARKARRNAARLESVTEKTFRQCAIAYITSHQSAWTNAKHIRQWGSTLENYVYPVFGDLSVSAINTGLVMQALEPIWLTHTETASRLRGRIEAVLDWATVRGYRKGENPARWKGHLDKLLPAKSTVAKTTHFAALPYAEIGDFMVELRDRGGMAARGLEFLILTTARTGEVLGARWDEIQKDVWTIPASRMKSGVEHRVPLSPGTKVILRRARKLALSEYVFPGRNRNRPLAGATFLDVLKKMEHVDTTVHGFRSTFRDWAAEQTNFPREVAETALAHTLTDKVEAAYRRGDLFEKRRRLMEAWAGYCNTPSDQKGKVVTMAARGG